MLLASCSPMSSSMASPLEWANVPSPQCVSPFTPSSLSSALITGQSHEQTYEFNVPTLNTVLSDDAFQAIMCYEWPEYITPHPMRAMPHIQTFLNHRTRIGFYTTMARKRIVNRYLEKRKRRLWGNRIIYPSRQKQVREREREYGRFISRSNNMAKEALFYVKEHPSILVNRSQALILTGPMQRLLVL